VNMEKKITTLIPTYRRPEYLRRTILSALGQTYSNLQVSIFDDASNDDTKGIVSDLCKTDSRIKYHSHTHNIGSLANHKYALKSVNTPYFSIISDDDFLVPDFYENAIKILDKNPKIMFVIMDCLIVDENINLVRPHLTNNSLKFFIDLTRFDVMHSGEVASNWTAMVFRKEAAEIYSNMDDRYDIANDMRFLFHTAARFPFAYYSKVGAFFTTHIYSASAARNNLDLVHHSVMISRYIDIFKDNNVDLYIRDRARFYSRKLLFNIPIRANFVAALKRIIKNWCDATDYGNAVVERDIMCFHYEGYFVISKILSYLHKNNVIGAVIRFIFTSYYKKLVIKNKLACLDLQNGIYKDLFEHSSRIE
jgi:glycosyltransferase involved in cell wall biosynthesis